MVTVINQMKSQNCQRFFGIYHPPYEGLKLNPDEHPLLGTSNLTWNIK